ncbi:hypothetical protein JCM6882_007192 [Rhodosporidiobolus microsporus]
MTFGALAAVGACVQIVKTLWEYYNLHQRNKALLDILEGFSQNLEISIERLQAREEMLGLGENDALKSIEKDFTNAKNWLLANDKNLRSIWTALQAADKLKDLDDRLTKAFASKMSVAIFSALQDTRQGIVKLQTTVDGLPANLEAVCRTATKESIQEAIVELKKEAYEAVGGSEGREKGFKNGEAEKIISQLVDQLAEQERLKEDEELLAAAGYAPLMPGAAASSSSPPVPYTPASSSASRRSSYMPSPTLLVEDPFEASLDAFEPAADPFEPATTATDKSSIMSRRQRRASVATMLTSRSVATSATMVDSEANGSGGEEKRRKKKDRIPQGAIVFNPKDPFSEEDLIDPILANDGLIHSRWTLVEGTHKNLRDPSEPLVIVGDVVQLREAIFTSFPERRNEFTSRRQSYREETTRLYESSTHAELPSLINRLSHVLLFEPTSVSLRIRRGIAFYRLRFLSESLADLTRAIELSTRSAEGEPDQHDPDIDALRARALVLEEMHDNSAALRDIEAVLSAEPHDVLSLSLRAIIRSNSADVISAQADLAATNAAVRSGKAYRSRLGDADCDLEYLTRGWAYCGVHDFASATADFGFSASLRDPPEPYALACRGLAKIKAEEASGSVSAAILEDGLTDLDDAVEQLRKVAVAVGKKADAPARYTSGAPTLKVGEDGLPPAAYACLLLRGAARQAQGEYELALMDLTMGFRLRPPQVRDVAALRCASAQLKSECGDKEGARQDFDMALALCEPGQQFAVVSAREECGL